MNDRMASFLNGLDEQCRRHGLDAELVLVEWNPPPDKPQLWEILPAPSRHSPLVVRYVIVPRELHSQWQNSESIPLFQMIAKNVGIRRALAPFILATNVDLLFSDELIEFLANGVLDSNAMYRANRCDVPLDILDLETFEDQLERAKSGVIRRLGLRPDGTNHGAPAWRKLVWVLKRSILPGGRITRVDSDACGDFTLLSKDSWERIRGYPELGLYSIYVDGLGCHAAIASGCRQIILPPEMCTYHADHETGWMSMSVSEKIGFIAQRPSLDHGIVTEACEEMLRVRKPLLLNGEDWGLRSENLREIRVPADQSVDG